LLLVIQKRTGSSLGVLLFYIFVYRLVDWLVNFFQHM
jgi:hypothetical protein